MAELLAFPHVDGVHEPVGRYVHALVHDGIVYVSGAAPLDASGQIVGPGDVERQARQLLENAGRVLAAAGSSFRSVLRETVYLRNVADARLTRSVREEVYAGHVPASTLIGAGALAHPEMLLEMDFIAAVESGPGVQTLERNEE